MRTAVIRRRVAQRGAVFAATAAALGLLASCGTSTNAGNGGMKMSGMPASTTQRGSATAGGGGGTPAASAPSSTVTAVAVKSFAFAPATLTVSVGTTVTWTNADDEPHTVTADHGGPLHSPPLDTGGVYRYTFTKAGTYTYFCTIHPFMHASVVVRP
ncbi:cupredoxin family copper-binding protein [Streptomyces sp. CBMA152]|uniref:cupredoxin domain-containing protein n=1 Tax=Streptomyces sp. CBMA152 TaxID=1896312 RepID=UPI001660A537|nr:cupredoxin family copper-binding protein [Streptomyces sp. CBMA152]MBD0741424.1 hypothetical protein [Streptomyces sp. CBMA152]